MKPDEPRPAQPPRPTPSIPAEGQSSEIVFSLGTTGRNPEAGTKRDREAEPHVVRTSGTPAGPDRGTHRSTSEQVRTPPPETRSDRMEMTFIPIREADRLNAYPTDGAGTSGFRATTPAAGS